MLDVIALRGTVTVVDREAIASVATGISAHQKTF